MKKKMALPQRFKTWLSTEPKNRYIVLAFALPFVLLGLAFALHGVFPFGNRQILVTDFWHQYYPFLSDLWHKLREGSSLLWSWSNGIGTNYLGLIAYYLGSPLNLLIVLFPHAILREVITVLLLTKVGLAGMFCSMYLKYAFRRNDISITVFSLFYALCAFTMGYYWNIMWFDTFALLPLVILGVRALVREGKYKTFVVALALSFFINYYIGFFTCIFVAIMFFVFCITGRVSIRQFGRRFLRIALFSLIAIGLSALLTLPGLTALGNSYSAVNKFPTSPEWYESFVDILGNVIAFAQPTAKEGLPNLYSGMLSVVLLAVFLLSRKIKLREKIIYTGLLAFLLVSCNLNILNYIWHGFHFTNMIPYRFSFLFSFLMVVIAYRAFTLIDHCDKLDYAGMGLVALWALYAAYAGPQENLAVLGSAIVAAGYILLIVLYRKKKLRRQIFAGLLCALALAEASVNTYIGVSTVGTTARSGYPDSYDAVQEVLTLRQEEESGFARTEFTKWFTVNPPTVYGVNGISTFSSTVNVSTTLFLEGLGLAGWPSGNRYTYAETTPLANAFLNIKYLVDRGGNYVDDVYWREVGQSGNATLLENEAYLPFGFMVEQAVTGYEADANDNPFVTQNQLFSMATGLDEEVYTLLDIIHVGHRNIEVTRSGYGRYSYTVTDPEDAFFKWNYELPEDGVLYAYVSLADDLDVSVLREGEEIHTVNRKRPYIFACGAYLEGEIMSLKADAPTSRTTGSAKVYVGLLNQEVFDRGYRLLRDEVYEITHFGDTRIAGKVTALTDGLLYTSLPYENGWTAVVDGTQTEIVTLNGSMAMVPLTAGEHEVEFRYVPPGFRLGLCISGASLLFFLLFIRLERKRPHSALALEGVDTPEPEAEEDAGVDGEEGAGGYPENDIGMQEDNTPAISPDRPNQLSASGGEDVPAEQEDFSDLDEPCPQNTLDGGPADEGPDQADL